MNIIYFKFLKKQDDQTVHNQTNIISIYYLISSPFNPFNNNHKKRQA